MKPALVFALTFGLASGADAHDILAGDLSIIHPMAFETPKAAKAGAGYMTISNDGETDDVLLGVKADFPHVSLHLSEEKDGVTSMAPVDQIAIPAGDIIELVPGGYHVMFMGLGGDPFEEGEKIPATLVFEKAGEVAIEFYVEPRRDAHGASDHSGHSTSD